MKLEILTFGNELLSGLRTNSHLAFLGEELSRRGLHLQRNVVVGDEETAIRREFLASWERAEIVVTTGGLGATSDDVTRETIARALKLDLVYDANIEKDLEAFFRGQGKEMPEIVRKLAYRLEGADVLSNRIGTTPGLWLERDGKILIMLPGRSSEMHTIFHEQVLPRLRAKDLVAEEEYVQVRTAGLEETFVFEKIQPLLDLVPGIAVASSPHAGMVDLRLRSANAELSHKQLEGVGFQIARRLGDDFVCFGHRSLEQIVCDLLLERDRTLAVAESCTGGLLASRLTDVAGASEFFLGGVVCYTNDAKIQLLGIPETLINQHGAVSAEVAVAMAGGVGESLGSDYALSVTGFAGPTGGTEENPVGTVYLGLATRDGSWTRKVHFTGERMHVRRKAATALLDWLRRTLMKNEVAQPAENLAEG